MEDARQFTALLKRDWRRRTPGLQDLFNNPPSNRVVYLAEVKPAIENRLEFA